MKKLVFAVISAVLVAVFVLSSCSAPSLIATVDALLTPPLYYSEYEGLVKAFNSSVDTGVILCNPKSGDHLSAITVSDVDGDGEEEGIVFYRDALQENVAHFALFKCSDDVWSKKCDFKGYGNEVKSLTLTDLDGDGIDEVFVIWSYSGIDSGSVFSVYRAGGGNLRYEQIAYESCEVATAVDFNDDLKDDIFFISSSKEENTVSRTAGVMSLKDGELVSLGSVPADPNVISYVSLKTEKSDSHSPMRVYIDASKSNNMMITELFYIDGETGGLVNPFYDAETGSNNVTLRFENLQCTDVNADGRIEIPVQTLYSETVGEEEEELYLTDWIYFENGTPAMKISTFVNVEDGYLVNLGILGSSELFIRKHKGGDWASWSVYKKSDKSVFGEVLFTIIKVPKSRWEKDMLNSGRYITILKQLDSVICVNINQNGQSEGLDEAKIRKIVTRLPS